MASEQMNEWKRRGAEGDRVCEAGWSKSTGGFVNKEQGNFEPDAEIN